MVKITMNSSRGGELSSRRLKALHNHYHHEKHIWDIGCDHGLLGLSFREFAGVESINLVDPSRPVIEQLQKKLKDSYISKGTLNIYHSQGQQLKIESEHNCIFIAGMGGKEIGEIIAALLPQLDETSRIVISPHRKILELRKFLGTLALGLIKEEVILEDQQFYQILNLQPKEGPKVSLYGQELWQTESGILYREHQLKYFGHHEDEASREYVQFLKQLSL